MCSSTKHWNLLQIIICNATILNLEYWKSTESKLLLLIKLATWAVHGAELSKCELHRPHIWVVCESSLIWSTPLRQVHPLFLCARTTAAAHNNLQRPEQSREDSVELYHSLMYTTVFVEVYQCVCRSIPYSILQLIPTKLGGNQLQNTVWCMYGILLQTHWYSGIVLQIVV